MNKLSPIPQGSLFFAPLEGITDEAFRKTILSLYPEWDYLACDFLRVPSAGKYPLKHIVRHFGKNHFEVPWIKEKTMFQILTSFKAFTEAMVKDITYLNIPWLDLNLGCPSNTVCKNQGGSYLLQDLIELRKLVRLIRENFNGRFTAKIRIGYKDSLNFLDTIKMLNDEGVEAITVHARTREQMYKEPADWNYISKAVATSQVPIIGNGDIWKVTDINRMLKETGCHGVMIARGALKSPWIASHYRVGIEHDDEGVRIFQIKKFFNEYRNNLEEDAITPRGLLKQSKSVSRFMFDGMSIAENARRDLLLAASVPEFYDRIERL